ncbi:MAG: hypothetical protein GY811_16085 [Myxococcales bacterium]|nr:hypothetical protein [Myxococcales bacterium]
MSRLLLSFTLLAALLVVSSSSPALAQPGQYAPPAPLPLRLSDDDLHVLDRGRITTGQYISGGVIGSHFGFGIGHMVQQRWTDTGWIFTMGESAALTSMIVGAVSCLNDDTYDDSARHSSNGSNDRCSRGLLIGGLIGFAGLRIWEIVDLWVAPPAHNRRYDELRAGGPSRYSLSIAPTGAGSGVASISLAF